MEDVRLVVTVDRIDALCAVRYHTGSVGGNCHLNTFSVGVLPSDHIGTVNGELVSRYGVGGTVLHIDIVLHVLPGELIHVALVEIDGLLGYGPIGVDDHVAGHFYGISVFGTRSVRLAVPVLEDEALLRGLIHQGMVSVGSDLVLAQLLLSVHVGDGVEGHGIQSDSGEHGVIIDPGSISDGKLASGVNGAVEISLDSPLVQFRSVGVLYRRDIAVGSDQDRCIVGK